MNATGLMFAVSILVWLVCAVLAGAEDKGLSSGIQVTKYAPKSASFPGCTHIAFSGKTEIVTDGSILTAFGIEYRIMAGEDSPQSPRDVGLIVWRLNTKPVNAESTIRDAAFDLDLRNVFDPKE